MSSPAVQRRFLFVWKESEYFIEERSYYGAIFLREVSPPNLLLFQLNICLLIDKIENLDLFVSRCNEYFFLRTNVHVFYDLIPALHSIHGLCIFDLVSVD